MLSNYLFTLLAIFSCYEYNRTVVILFFQSTATAGLEHSSVTKMLTALTESPVTPVSVAMVTPAMVTCVVVRTL